MEGIVTISQVPRMVGNKLGSLSNCHTVGWKWLHVVWRCYRYSWKLQMLLNIKQFYCTCIQFTFSSIYLCICISTSLFIYTVFVWTRCRYYSLPIGGGSWDGNAVNLEMHLETIIEQLGRYIWRLLSYNLQIHREMVMEQDCRYTQRL